MEWATHGQGHTFLCSKTHQWPLKKDSISGTFLQPPSLIFKHLKYKKAFVQKFIRMNAFYTSHHSVQH